MAAVARAAAGDAIVGDGAAGEISDVPERSAFILSLRSGSVHASNVRRCLREALIAQMMLAAIRETYAPVQDELAALFHTELITPDRADAFARALEHCWAGRFDESIHITLPRIEAVLRAVLVAVGGVVYKEPRPGHSGGVKTLGDILRDRSQFLPEQWLHPLRVLLTDRLGLNLRNDYMHGLATHTENQRTLQQDTTLVLNLAAHLRLFSLPPTATAPAEGD